MDFVYIDSKERLDAFSQFVKNLNIKKIQGTFIFRAQSQLTGNFQDWWDHKEMSDWIIPCLVRSQSNIRPEDWDSTPATTNTGETQHHWTNSMTGIKLTLVEAIERSVSSTCIIFFRSSNSCPSAHELDENTAHEIKASLKNGILANSQNEAYHRMSQSLQCQSKAARKVRETDELTKLSEGIATQIAELKESRRQSSAKEKELRERLKSAKTTTGSAKRGRTTKSTRSEIVSASSTGWVRTAPVISGGSQLLVGEAKC